MDIHILETVISIASKYSGIKTDNLNADSSVNFDLRIDGDDIEDMIAEINKTFNLNFEGFDYSRYFCSEGEINIFTSIRALFELIFIRKEDRQKKDYDFKLGDFVRWIQNGYWEELS